MRIIAFSLLFVLSYFSSNGQEYYLRAYSGLTYYQGDLAPLTSRWSYSKGHFAYGFYAGAKMSDFYTLGIRYMKGRLSGYDADTENPARRKRNLHFESNIFELGLIADFSLNKFLTGLNRYGIQWYVTVGINVFTFNPQAQYNGEWIPLKRLKTEGQGLYQYPDRKNYSLAQINIPFGLNMNFKVNYNVQIGIEVAPRWTFTDYLDDVSTSYINYNELKEIQGEQSAILANRTGEFLGTDPVIVPTGTMRGDPTDNDWYLFTGVYVAYIIGAKKPEEPKPEPLQ